MALLTPAQLREHTETDLGDDALQRLLDDADAEIVRRYGPHAGDVTEHHTPGSGDAYLFTNRPVDALGDISERFLGPAGETVVVLDASDYILEGDRQIRRRENGTNSRAWWAPIVSVEYTPVSDGATRVRVIVDVVKLALSFDGTGSTRVGDVGITHADYARERERLLRILQPTMQGFFA